MNFKCAHTDVKKVSELLLVQNPKNNNNHSKEQIERLAKIIDFQGQRSPIVISKRSGFIVKGHGRLFALDKLGWEMAAVDYQDYKTEAEEYADMTADNEIARWAEFNTEKFLEDIKTVDLGDFELLGLKDLPDLLAPEKVFEADEDEVPEVVEPKAKLGDIYKLGDHRLMCGDSTSADAVEKLMNGETADITFTSPPYNLGENAKLRGYNGDANESVYLEKSDHKSQEEYLSFLSAFTLLAMKHSTTVFCNVQLLAGNKLAIPKYWMAFHDHLIDLMIWDKEHAQPSAAQRVLNSVFELIFIFTEEKGPKRSIKTGKTFRGTLQNIFRMNPVRSGKDAFQKNHGAVFPIAFAEHFIANFSEKSALDLFGGSGSTLIACEKTNRKCFMMELDPHYVDVIIARWEKFTGKKAELLNGQAS